MRSGQKLIQLRSSRGDLPGYCINFLDNFARSASVMHKCIPVFHQQQNLFGEAVRNYVIALVSALETYYRDLFVHYYADQPGVVSAIVSRLRPKRRQPSLEHEYFSAAEMASVVLSFQRLEDIDAALSPLIGVESYFHEITAFSIVCAVPSRSPGIFNMQLPADWKQLFADLLESRHRYIHDANSACETSREFIAKAECMILALGQLTSFMLMTKKEKNPAGGMFAFLLVEDLISDDWEICANPSLNHIQ